jgi:hypothetical protein
MLNFAAHICICLDHDLEGQVGRCIYVISGGGRIMEFPRFTFKSMLVSLLDWLSSASMVKISRPNSSLLGICSASRKDEGLPAQHDLLL